MQLPVEIYAMIIQRLGPVQLNIIKATNRYFNKAANTPLLTQYREINGKLPIKKDQLQPHLRELIEWIAYNRVVLQDYHSIFKYATLQGWLNIFLVISERYQKTPESLGKKTILSVIANGRFEIVQLIDVMSIFPDPVLVMEKALIGGNLQLIKWLIDLYGFRFTSLNNYILYAIVKYNHLSLVDYFATNPEFNPYNVLLKILAYLCICQKWDTVDVVIAKYNAQTYFTDGSLLNAVLGNTMRPATVKRTVPVLVEKYGCDIYTASLAKLEYIYTWGVKKERAYLAALMDQIADQQ